MAVSVTDAAAVTAEVVAVNVPVVLPAAMVNVAGTVRDAELLARLMEAPPEPALADKVTVHVVEAPPATVAGPQLTEEIVTTPGAVSVREAAWDEPL